MAHRPAAGQSLGEHRTGEVTVGSWLHRHRVLWPGLATGLVLAAAYLCTAAPGISWANNGGDGGDLIAAVVSGGVPHPSGYPSYWLLGRLFLAMPAADPAFRLTLLSAATMALAGGTLSAIVAFAFGGGWGTAAALVAGLGFGLAPLPWSQAVIVEVHGLNALFAVITLGLIARLSSTDNGTWKDGALGLAAGLGVGNHLTLGLMLVPLAVALWIRARSGQGRRAIAVALAYLLGLAVYALLPVLAARHPPVNWGDASTWSGFWWLVTGGPYRGLVFGLPLSEVPRRMASGAGLLLAQFGPIGLGMIGVGLAFGRSRRPWVDRTAAWMAGAYTLLALGYNAPDSSAYLIPACVGLAWWLALGLGVALSWVARFRPRLTWMALGMLVVAGTVRLPSVVRSIDPGGDHRAQEYIDRVMRLAPRGALVLTSTDHDSFPLWYAQYALGQRPDLRLVVVPLTQFDWYRRGLAYTYPDLSLPSTDSSDVWTWEAELLQRNPRPVCRTQVEGEGDGLQVRLDCAPWTRHATAAVPARSPFRLRLGAADGEGVF